MNYPSIALDHVAAANAYHEMVHDPSNATVAHSYDLFINETLMQWDELQRTVNVKFFFGEPRYADSRAMLTDLDNGHLWSLLTGPDHGMPAEHPMLASADDGTLCVNDVFRAVHDAYGHGTSRGSFGVVGEMNAWLAHRMSYSPGAHLALWCETRGQAAWTNAYGDHAELPLVSRPFAAQKAGLVAPQFV